MSIVIPALLTPSRDDLEEKLTRLVGLVEAVQIDVIDGRFVGPPTWPYTVEGGVRELSLPRPAPFHYEVDLMVENPEEVAGAWIEAGVERILVHIESARALPRFVRELRDKYGHDKGFAPGLLSFGLAINIDTDSAALEPYLEATDYVQFMGIRTIGKQGLPFDPRVIRKIEAFKKAHPDVTIQVDGAVNLESAPQLLAAGVDRLAIGSALWKAPDLAAEIAKFEALAAEYGRYA